mgnify:CR=1 FL=1
MSHTMRVLLATAALAMLVCASAGQASERRIFIIANHADDYGVDRCLAQGSKCGSAAATAALAGTDRVSLSMTAVTADAGGDEASEPRPIASATSATTNLRMSRPLSSDVRRTASSPHCCRTQSIPSTQGS